MDVNPERRIYEVKIIKEGYAITNEKGVFVLYGQARVS